MAKNYFIAHNFNDLAKVNQEIINWFKTKQYEINSKLLKETYFIQAKKTGIIRTLLGANLAFKVRIYWSNDAALGQEFIVETRIGKWITNIAGAGFTSLFMGGIPLFTGLANAGWALILENDLVSYLEDTLNLGKIAKTEDIYPEKTEITSFSARQKAKQQVNQEFNKLEEAFKNGIISKQEFTHKKVILDEKIDQYEAEFLIEEKIAKLQKAFEDGILNTFEYEQKIKQIHEKVNAEIIDKRRQQKKEAKIAFLKEALENGILTEEEYRQKISQL